MPGLASAAGMAFLSFLCFAGFLAFYFLIATYVLRRAGRRALLIFIPNLVIAFYASGMYHVAHPFIFLFNFLYWFVYGFVVLFGYVAGIAYYVLLFALALYIAHAGQR